MTVEKLEEVLRDRHLVDLYNVYKNGDIVVVKELKNPFGKLEFIVNMGNVKIL